MQYLVKGAVLADAVTAKRAILQDNSYLKYGQALMHLSW
jgi:hypothetical protein